MNYESMDARVLRLKVMVLESRSPHRNIRPLSLQEADDLDQLLEEIHRLHLVVRSQAIELEKRRKKK